MCLKLVLCRCTMVYHMILAAKTGNGPQRYAKTLFLIADNYSENKSNGTAAFCSLLVMKEYLAHCAHATILTHVHRWYTEVQLLWGPVGHTHNGIDACHRIHNQVCSVHRCHPLVVLQKKFWLLV